MRLPHVIILVLVERVVEFYEGKTEDIINALLEDNLHPEIAALDRNMLSKAELEQSKIIMPLKKTAVNRANPNYYRKEKEYYTRTLSQESKANCRG